MKSLRARLKEIPALRLWVMSLRQIRSPHSLIERVRLASWYRTEYQRYSRLPQNPTLPLTSEFLYPAIHDNTITTPIEPIYFYQNAWCARKIFEARPAHHYDVASHISLVSIVSQCTPITMVDIRPIELTLPGLSFVEGDITSLPFQDNELPSLSSICVIEHIGLGRYGDPLDPFGTEKAAAELVRVLGRGGNLYITVPVDTDNRIYFNAHRAFTREYILTLFKDLALVEEQYLYGTQMQGAYDQAKGFGTGMYHFTKVQ